ncbi:MAG: helix-turn-helix transcriptional regulator [Haloplanus sp.]
MSDTALGYLVGSTTRPDTLTALRDQDRLSIRALEDRVAASRRTLKRTLGAMESRGWVRNVDGAYELTSLGAAILSAYDRFRDHERIAEQFRPFLERTPGAVFDPSIDALADATIRYPDDPESSIDRLVELRADASRLRECAPFLLLESVRQLADRITDDGPSPDVTLVIGDGTPTTDQYTAEYCERFATLAAADSVDIHLHSDIPFPFGVFDGHAFAGAMEPDGMPHAMIESDHPELVDWAERTFDDYLAAADPLE